MDDAVLRERLVALLAGEGAHVAVAKAFARVPQALRTSRPRGFEHSLWELLEHMRSAQEDILRWTLEAGWTSPAWPEGYWPKSNPKRLQPRAWEKSLASFDKDLEGVIALVRDRRLDLSSDIPHAPGVSYLQEVLLVADHNAYHLGQVVDLRRALGSWPPR